MTTGELCRFAGHGPVAVSFGDGQLVEVASDGRPVPAGCGPGVSAGIVLADGPGLSGGPSVPTSQPVFSLAAVDSPPDPYALVELGRDLRPPDYAATFTRMAVQRSIMDEPITVVAKFRPAWLRAVAEEPGVAEASTTADALSRYRA